MNTLIFRNGDPGRPDVEQFVRDVYWGEYGALVGTFPPLMIASFGSNQQIACAAGLRSSTDGFFSEVYLSTPVEYALSSLSGMLVNRQEIFEVCNLASGDPRATAGFIKQIVTYGKTNGFGWAFFTLTRRLWRMVNYLGLETAFLANADRNRVANHENWGSYYSADPKVFATHKPEAANATLPSKRGIARETAN